MNARDRSRKYTCQKIALIPNPPYNACMKKCSKCGLPKPPKDFHKDSKGKLDSEGVRRSAACKTCKNSRRAKAAPVEPNKLLLSYEFNIFKTQRSDVEIVIRKPHIRAQGATVDDVISMAVEKLRG